MNPQDNSFGKYKYANGKIYKLCCKDPTITEIYIGSTLEQYTRKHAHKNACNNPNSKNYSFYVYQYIRQNGGFENWNLVILEEYAAENKNDLFWKEREWIERLQPSLNCMKKPIVSKDERAKNRSEYREANKEKISEQKKEYREANKDKILERDRKYYQDNKDKISERNKEYREANKDKLSEKNKKWREANRNKILEKNKKYYEENREIFIKKVKNYRVENKDKISKNKKRYNEENKQKISERKKERVNCDICNKELARASLTRHKRTIHKDT